MQVHLSELDILSLEHHRRMNEADRYGWLLWSVRRDRRQTKLGALLSFVPALLLPKRSGREVAGSSIALDAAATRHLSPGLA